MAAGFDLDAYLDTLGPMTTEQRSSVGQGLAEVVARGLGDDPAFLRHVALVLATLVLVGEVTAFDDDTWDLVERIRRQHGPPAPGAER